MSLPIGQAVQLWLAWWFGDDVAPEALDRGGRRIRGVVGQMKEDTSTGLFKSFLLELLPVGWTLR